MTGRETQPNATVAPTSCATGGRRREAAIAADLDSTMALRERTYWINTHGEAQSHGGTPDRLGVCEGRALAIEIKRPGERPTTRQLVELRRWQAAGALAGWVTSVRELDALLAHLHDREWTNPLSGPGDPTVGEPHAGSATAPTAGGP